MLKFYHWQTKLSIVFLEVTDYFVHFCNACQILKSAEPQFVSHFPSKQKWCSLKKGCPSVVQSTSQSAFNQMASDRHWKVVSPEEGRSGVWTPRFSEAGALQVKGKSSHRTADLTY